MHFSIIVNRGEAKKTGKNAGSGPSRTDFPEPLSASGSGEVRKAPGAPPARFLSGFILYDKDRKAILHQHSEVVRDTSAVLAEDAEAGPAGTKVRIQAAGGISTLTT